MPGRGRNNTLVPMCRQTRDHIAQENDGLVTARQVNEHLERNADAVLATLRALDQEQALRSQRHAAVKTALIEWPSYRGEEGEFVHLDPSVQHPSHVWLKVWQYRKER